ncbi:hypothetical protein GCM10010176_099220 [Nonomuraea spiralis]|nr:hypothetical protein GCM10010176_099220 [Nonomuraea spiralis]
MVVACLAMFAGVPLRVRLGAPGRTMLALGIVAVVLAWPGVWRRATVSTVSNRSMSVAGLVVGVLAAGIGVVNLVLDEVIG